MPTLETRISYEILLERILKRQLNSLGLTDVLVI